MMTDPGELSLLTVGEVAALLRCSTVKVRRMASAGELVKVHVGTLVRITPESVAAYRQRLIEAAQAS